MPYIMEIYVDGGCRRNGKPDAYGAAAACVKHKYGGYETHSRDLPSSPRPTNQRAEISAIILALEIALQRYGNLHGTPFLDVTIYSDSRYAIGCMTTWIYRWSENGWRNAAGNEIANYDLIREASNLDDQVKEEGRVTYTWIPREQNTVADEVANEAMNDQWNQRNERNQNTYYQDSYSSSE